MQAVLAIHEPNIQIKRDKLAVQVLADLTFRVWQKLALRDRG